MQPAWFLAGQVLNYLRLISPQWQETTVLYEMKSQTERDRPAKLTIKSKDTLCRRKVKRFARTGSVRLLGGLKILVEKIPQKLTESEPITYLKHHTGKD